MVFRPELLWALFAYPFALNFINQFTLNTIIVIPFYYNFHTPELFVYPFELFVHSMGLKNSELEDQQNAPPP